MSEVSGVTGEQTAWLTVSREIEQLLAEGFVGDIILHCPGNGTVRNYHASEFRKPGEARTVALRRTDGPRSEDHQRRR